MMSKQHKVKYVALGVVGTLLLAPLALRAIDTIPFRFQEGDVLSASVMNSLFSRINSITKLPVASDLIGSWDCTESRSGMGNSAGFVSDQYNLIGARQNTLTFSAGPTSDTFGFTASAGAPFEAHNVQNYYGPVTSGAVAALASGTRLLSVAKNVTNSGALWQANYKVTYLSSDSLEINGSGGLWEGSMSCRKTTAPPAPVDSLTATLQSQGTTYLSWEIKDTNATGFAVQQKDSYDLGWRTVGTAGGSSNNWTIQGLTTGSHWFRVLANNANGNSMSSSEVKVTVVSQ